MREELDNILEQIGAAFLATAEYCVAITAMNGETSDKAKYQALRAVLMRRSGVGGEVEALDAYFKSLSLNEAGKKPSFSNIFIGTTLE